jgi:hypothetical protein
MLSLFQPVLHFQSKLLRLWFLAVIRQFRFSFRPSDPIIHCNSFLILQHFGVIIRTLHRLGHSSSVLASHSVADMKEACADCTHLKSLHVISTLSTISYINVLTNNCNPSIFAKGKSATISIRLFCFLGRLKFTMMWHLIVHRCIK